MLPGSKWAAHTDREIAMPKVVDQLYSRPPWERMMRIHERIQSGNHPNCNQLAHEFEVSSRTIKRDIDFMKCLTSFGVFAGKDDFEVVIEFDAWAADLLHGRRWHPSQEVIEFPKGGLRMRLRLNNIEEVERWVLGWGKHATVIRPAMLAKRIEQAAADLLRKYREAPDPSERLESLSAH